MQSEVVRVGIVFYGLCGVLTGVAGFVRESCVRMTGYVGYAARKQFRRMEQ